MRYGIVAALMLGASISSNTLAAQSYITLTGTGGTSWLDNGVHLDGPFSITGLFDSALTVHQPGGFTAAVDTTPITNVTFSSPAYTGPIANSFLEDVFGSNNGRRSIFGFQWFGIFQSSTIDWSPFQVTYGATDTHTVTVSISPCTSFSCVSNPTRLTLVSSPTPESGTLTLLALGLGALVAARKGGPVRAQM